MEKHGLTNSTKGPVGGLDNSVKNGVSSVEKFKASDCDPGETAKTNRLTSNPVIRNSK